MNAMSADESRTIIYGGFLALPGEIHADALRSDPPRLPSASCLRTTDRPIPASSRPTFWPALYTPPTESLWPRLPCCGHVSPRGRAAGRGRRREDCGLSALPSLPPLLATPA